MNRAEALQWCVDNIKAWPKEYKTCLGKVSGWYWYRSIGHSHDNWTLNNSIVGTNPITEQDWIAAKQPTPLTRDQALVWLVKNVKVWPSPAMVINDAIAIPPAKWRWSIPPCSNSVVFFNGASEVTEKNWRYWKDLKNKDDAKAAQPTPASNKPSWADAPEWAKSLCQHESGVWSWSSWGKNSGAYPGVHGKWFADGSGKWMDISTDAPNQNWRDTLEHRPGTEESTPIDTRQADSIAAGEALTEAATITPEQVASIVGDAMTVGSEQDPSGLSSSTPGAKLDAGKVRPDLILSGMPRALLAVAEVGTFGAAKYSDNGWLSVPDGIKRYTAAMDRHRLKEGIELMDADSDLRHAAHLAWNALARLELMLINENK